MKQSSIIPSTAHHKVYAGYRQFYLIDDQATGSTAANDFWTPQASKNMLAINPGILGVGTGSYGEVPVDITLALDPPVEPLDAWDHVVEASIDVRGTEIQLFPCPDPIVVGRVAVPPGTYRVRIYAGNLESTRETEEGDDYYRVYIWPAPYAPVHVLKRW